MIKAWHNNDVILISISAQDICPSGSWSIFLTRARLTNIELLCGRLKSSPNEVGWQNKSISKIFTPRVLQGNEKEEKSERMIIRTSGDRKKTDRQEGLKADISQDEDLRKDQRKVS